MNAAAFSSGGMEAAGSPHHTARIFDGLIHAGLRHGLFDGGDQAGLSLLPFRRRECHSLRGAPIQMERLPSGPHGEGGFGESEESGDSFLSLDGEPTIGLTEESHAFRDFFGEGAAGIWADAKAVELVGRHGEEHLCFLPSGLVELELLGAFVFAGACLRWEEERVGGLRRPSKKGKEAFRLVPIHQNGRGLRRSRYNGSGGRVAKSGIARR
jgi:hypothetical protein